MRAARLLLGLCAVASAGCGTEIAQRADLHVGTLSAADAGPRARAALERADGALSIARHEAALEHYMEAAGHAGLTPEVALGLARANAGLGRLGQAERILRPLAQARPDDAAVQSEHGRLLLALGRPAEAGRVLRLAFALDPSDTLARDALSEALAETRSSGYAPTQEDAFSLGHEGGGLYVLRPPS